MTSISSYLTQGLLYFFPQQEDETLKEIPPMGPTQWKELAGLDIDPIEIPRRLLEASRNPSPFLPEYTIGQTHILCCIPKGLSVAKLFELAGKPTGRLEDKDFKENPETYWCWVAKKPILRGCPFKLQEKELHLIGYDVPTSLEVIVAIYAAKNLGNVILFPHIDNASPCKDPYDTSSYDIIGGCRSSTFCSFAPTWRSNAVSSVLR